MANPVAHLRFRSAVLFPATLIAAILGCSGQSPARSPNPHLVAGPGASGAAAQAFLSLLDESERVDASVSFDNPERINWSYVPQERAGIPLRAMDADQRMAALGLLNMGLSARGTRLARGIMDLEGTLRHEGDFKQGERMARVMYNAPFFRHGRRGHASSQPQERLQAQEFFVCSL